MTFSAFKWQNCKQHLALDHDLSCLSKQLNLSNEILFWQIFTCESEYLRVIHYNRYQASHSSVASLHKFLCVESNCVMASGINKYSN